MSDTSRPIYHNEAQMPRMDNNALFIRRQERRRQDGSIDLPQPMAHSFFWLSLHTNTRNSFTKLIEPNWRPTAWLPLVPLLCFSSTEALCIFKKKRRDNRMDLLSQDHLSGSHHTGILQACTKWNSATSNCGKPTDLFISRLDSTQDHEKGPFYGNMPSLTIRQAFPLPHLEFLIPFLISFEDMDQHKKVANSCCGNSPSKF